MPQDLHLWPLQKGKSEMVYEDPKMKVYQIVFIGYVGKRWVQRE